jgi:hypothetical protein
MRLAIVVLAAGDEVLRYRDRLANTTAALHLAAGQLVTSELGVYGGPLAFNSVNLVPHDKSAQ